MCFVAFDDFEIPFSMRFLFSLFEVYCVDCGFPLEVMDCFRKIRDGACVAKYTRVIRLHD